MLLWLACHAIAWTTVVDSLAPEDQAMTGRRLNAVLLNAYGMLAPLAYVGSLLPLLILAHIPLARGNSTLLKMNKIIDASTSLTDLLPVQSMGELLFVDMMAYVYRIRRAEQIWLGWVVALFAVRDTGV